MQGQLCHTWHVIEGLSPIVQLCTNLRTLNQTRNVGLQLESHAQDS